MSIKEKMGVIGSIKLWKVGGVAVHVKVLDYKNSYGKDRWLITPTDGIGQTWVEAEWV